jgi:hypothetical protein
MSDETAQAESAQPAGSAPASESTHDSGHDSAPAETAPAAKPKAAAHPHEVVHQAAMDAQRAVIESLHSEGLGRRK